MGNETTLNHSAIRTLCLWALCCGALCLQGCLELVRRPPADTPVVYQPAAQLTSPADTASTPQREVVIERPKRSRKQRQSIEQVNEYALWCIQNAMWNEARSHMERTLGQDSLSASLHNNLGIIYAKGKKFSGTSFRHICGSIWPRHQAIKTHRKTAKSWPGS